MPCHDVPSHLSDRREAFEARVPDGFRDALGLRQTRFGFLTAHPSTQAGLLHRRELREEDISPLALLLEYPERLGELCFVDVLALVDTHQAQVEPGVRLPRLPAEHLLENGTNLGRTFRQPRCTEAQVLRERVGPATEVLEADVEARRSGCARRCGEHVPGERQYERVGNTMDARHGPPNVQPQRLDNATP